MKRWHQRWFPTFYAIRRWWSQRLTSSGRVLFIVLLATLPGVITEQRVALQLFGTLLSTFVIVGVLNFLFRPRLSLSVSTPDTVACREPCELTIQLHNTAARPCYGIRSEVEHRDQEQWLPGHATSHGNSPVDLHPDEIAAVSMTVSPQQRGRWKAPAIRLSTTFPLNLMFRHQLTMTSREVIVTPTFSPVRLDPPSQGGASLLPSIPDTAPQQGDSWEYYGSREYVTGMPVRRWDYGAWARLGKPFVREYEQQTQANAAILVDVSPGCGSIDLDASLESVVSLAAGLVDGLLRDNWQVHLFLASGAEAWVQWEPTSSVRSDLMTRLAELTASSEPLNAMTAAAQASNLPLWDMTVFAALRCWDDERSDWVGQWQSIANDFRCYIPDHPSLGSPAFVQRHQIASVPGDSDDTPKPTTPNALSLTASANATDAVDSSALPPR